MKLLLVSCLIAAAVAAPPQILRYEFDNIGTGPFVYEFAQDDGTKAEATGELKNGGSENEFVAVRGSYEYVGADGVTYTNNYVADENGYHPQFSQGQGGAIPEEVIKSLGNPAAPAAYSQGQRSKVPAYLLGR